MGGGFIGWLGQAMVRLCALFCRVAQSDWSLLALAFVIYIRLPVLIKYHLDVPSNAKFIVLLLLLAILAGWIFRGERPAGWEWAALLVGAYGLACLGSLLYAEDVARAQDAMIRYTMDATIVITVAVLLRRLCTLRRVLGTLLAAGIIMGTISVYQQVTGTFDSDYWGFGQVFDGYRLSGPLGYPNCYAQIMLVLVPLALHWLYSKRTLFLRIVGAWALAVCGLSIVFTYSRGAVVGLIVMLGLMVVRRPPRPLTLLVAVAVAILLLQFAPSQYIDRIKTFRHLLPGFGGSVLEEPNFRGRLSAYIAGWVMLTDHPVLGVGVGNYETQYQRYSRRIGLDPRQEEKGAHNLYLEVAAETGLLGLALFSTLLWNMFRGMKRAREALASAGMWDDAEMVAALSIGMIGYLTAALFLHLDYTHHFWLLVGIGFAVPQVIDLPSSTKPSRAYTS